MPVPLTWSEIKALTQVGDTPTNLERADVWDTIAYYIQQAKDAADAAVATADALEDRLDDTPLPACYGRFDVGATPGASVTHKAVGCAIVYTNHAGADQTITVTFATALADTNYTIWLQQNGDADTGELPTSKTVNGFVLVLAEPSSGWAFFVMP